MNVVRTILSVPFLAIGAALVLLGWVENPFIEIAVDLNRRFD